MHFIQGDSLYIRTRRGGKGGAFMWKAPTVRTNVEKRQRHLLNAPYLDTESDLEFGRGVATPSSNLRFRNLLKSATWQFWDLYPSGISAKDPTCHKFRFENSSWCSGKSPITRRDEREHRKMVAGVQAKGARPAYPVQPMYLGFHAA